MDKTTLVDNIMILLLFLFLPWTSGAPVGICYGRVANNLPAPPSIVEILKSNQISNVRLFNAEPATLQSFYGAGINLMIGVPNEDLPALSAGTAATAIQWLQSNIFAHVPPNQVRYIAVGNEVFLKDPYFTPHVVPSIINLYGALRALGLSESIKLSSPQAASVIVNTYPPSSATFDPSLRLTIIPLLQFLRDTGSPFMANVYPYISYASEARHMSPDYALFRGGGEPVRDGPLAYDNMFDASVDAFVWALEREGFGGVAVVVAETGWPTAGGEAASAANALAFNGNVVRRAASNVGTPKRPGVGLEVYLFGLFDENEKAGEEYERHFGIFGLNGAKAYNLSFN
ncbi:hypothetical protein BT93_B2891 [Corymbia citriodora subsp. variegata]|nr:hypothetical protein BT93_B2891 [Corymbia citriodora subsp. variegata]